MSKSRFAAAGSGSLRAGRESLHGDGEEPFAFAC